MTTTHDPVREALRELVACKDLKDQIDKFPSRWPFPTPETNDQEAIRQEYARRKPAAWAAARAALAMIQAAPPAPSGVKVAEAVAWMAFEVIGRRPILEAFSTQERAEAFAETIKTPTEVHAVYLATPAPSPAAAQVQEAVRRPVQFPTMLRKMWSGGEVQKWLDENVNEDSQ